MKNIYGIIVFAAVLLAGVSCKKDPSLVISPESCEVSAAGGTVEIAVNANYNWIAAADALWIRVGTPFGTPEDNRLTLTVLTSDQPDKRESTVTITCEGITRQVRIVQGQMNMVVPVDSNDINLDWQEQTLEIEVNSNIDYRAEVSASEPWVKVMGTKALTPSKVMLSLGCNEDHVFRRASLLFTYDGQTLREISIVQEGRPRIIRVVHNCPSYDMPLFSGIQVKGSVFWGDGATEDYVPGLRHTYWLEGPFETIVEVTRADAVLMPDMVGIKKVDLSGF
ncbi:MAG: BACON domain-containing protein [Bacteroidales bacterium]|nr:BACON domain-containing protein [Bacteroidales bacterium]